MWHEARKQEKMIRGMIVDYRRRAERRKDFYEKIKADPTQFLQIHGRPCKIHLDPAVAAAGEGPAIMMQWQGDPSNLIDRFDVRAHLDYIPDVKNPEIPPEDLSTEERHCNYERYRILAQNAFLGMGEDKFLQQLAIEEQFGVTLEEKELQREKLNEKKSTGAAIGYNYNDPGAQPSSSNGTEPKKVEKDSDDDSDLEILDVDLSIDVNKMEPSQAHDLNAYGPLFGMAGCDLFSFLTGDADDAEHQKQLLIEEKEKAMYSGRKSRRERRAHRDKKLATRVVSPPSYAAPSSHVEKSVSRSPSRSPSPEAAEQIQFITSFGGEDDEAKPPSSKTLYSEKLKQNLRRTESYSEVARKPKLRSPVSEESYPCPIGPRGPNSRSRSLSRSRSSKSRSPVRSRSRRTRSRSRSRRSRSSRSRSSRSSSYRRSRSRSRNYRSRRSRSPNYTKHKKSRSISYDSGSDRGESSKPSVPRYYGRKKEEDKSSSEISLDSGSSDTEVVKNKIAVGNKSNANQNQLRSSGSSSKGPSREALSLKEKLKKKMQAQLSRQLRADKRAEAERVERESRRQARRDEEMRELALKLRRKQREMRHRYRRSSDESSRSRSSSRDSAAGDKKHSRSRSRSPKQRPPVWEKNSAPYDEPPLPPLPPLHTLPPPPFIRKRNPEHEYTPKPYNDKRDYSNSKRERSNSASPRRIPVWETHRDIGPYRSDSNHESRRRYDDREFRYENPRRYDNENPRRYDSENPRRYDNEGPSYDSRYDPSRRPPYNRGGYKGFSRPTPPGVSPYAWQKDQENDDDDDRNKVKLVDY